MRSRNVGLGTNTVNPQRLPIEFRSYSPRKMETTCRAFQMYAIAHMSRRRQPEAFASRSARAPNRRGPNTLLKLCATWIAPGRRPIRARTTLRLSNPLIKYHNGCGSDGSQNLHTLCKFALRAGPEGGLKRSQTVSKGFKVPRTLGAEHTRASHAVSPRHETLGAERRNHVGGG